MADLRITVESNLNKVLLGLQQQGQAVDKFLPVIAEMLVSAVHDVFDAEGPGWAPLAASTIARRRGTTHKILQDTGALAGRIAPSYGSAHAEAVDGTTYGIFHAPDPQGRDWTDLGHFQAPLLDEVAAMITGQF